MPIVLVYNEEKATEDWDWNDIAGVRHHFPNTYSGMVTPGAPFIYYRGTRRLMGGRGEIEFFGQGTIGDVWLDETTRDAAPAARNWFCSIEDYRPFPKPVRAKDGENYVERIPKNRLQNIRRIEPDIYEQILFSAFGAEAAIVQDHLNPQEIELVDDVARVFLPRLNANGLGVPRGSYPPRSPRAKAIGDRAEILVMAALRNGSFGPAYEIRHVAAHGEKPGWDIEYRTQAGDLQRVEVKGTTLSAFASIEFTANEFDAARRHADDYWLYLVAGCESLTAKITRIRNPATMLRPEPIVFRMWYVGH